MKNKWLIVVLLMAVIIALVGCAKTAPTATPTQSTATPTPTATPAPKVIVWKAQNSYVSAPVPSYYPASWDMSAAGTGSIAEGWVKKFEEISGGRLKIEMAPAGSIVPVTEAFTALKNGVLDWIPFHFGGYYSGVMPEAEAEMLPYAFGYVWEYYDFMRYNGGAKFIEEAHAAQGVYYMPAPLSGYYTITSTKPIRTVADLKGIKLRTSGAPGAVLAAAGGSPVSMTYSEIYMALKLGTIDGVLSGPSYMEDQKAYEVVKYCIVYPNMTQMECNSLINMKSFRALPADLQNLIEKFKWDFAMDMSQKYRMQDDWVVRYANLKYGVELVTWSEEEATKIRQLAVEKAWPAVAAKSPATAKFVDMHVQYLKSIGKIK